METIRLFRTGIVSICLPVVLIAASVRLILIPSLLHLEYSMPGFPADEYGFSTADRLHWATYAWDYLVNKSDVSYLGDLRFTDGSPVFNERELSHMKDVKAVVSGALRTGCVALVLLLLAGIWAWHAEWLSAYRRAVVLGGWLTICLAGFIGIVVAVGMLASPALFWDFFSSFHALFFQGDSWLFAYSDTLIRLFPLRFWQDTFIGAALVVLSGGFVLAFALRERRAGAAKKA